MSSTGLAPLHPLVLTRSLGDFGEYYAARSPSLPVNMALRLAFYRPNPSLKKAKVILLLMLRPAISLAVMEEVCQSPRNHELGT